jgi:nicotinamidase-related amidase
MLVDSIWGKRMALVIVDPQRKFTLDVPDWDARMNKAVKAINCFSNMFRKYGQPVIFIHFDGESHCMYEGDDGDDWLPGIVAKDSDMVVHKQHMNCFKGTELEGILKDEGVESVLYAGMLTEYCVMSTYFAASERNLASYMAKDATIAYNEKGNEAAELICSTVTTEVLEKYLSGEQAPVRTVH